MCEWLGSVEWCDVRLACGGRTFTAHRAVLASVSLFLRRILLSCTQEETPTFIVLPDFDLEALSSVLYYIYNGEVIVEQHKLQMFLDVIKTLEIFIDPQYVQKLRESVGDRCLELVTYRESKWPENIFALNGGNSDNHEYVNIRKGERLRDIRLRCSLGETDFGDKRECHSWSDAKPSLDNSPAPYTDRQRNSFLRDLYIETYPQNGNVNGLTAGVLAIPNERYRAPTSVLLTNANCKLPSTADDTLVEISRKTAELTSYIPYVSREQQPCIQNCSRPYGESCAKRFHDFKNVDFSKTQILVENDLNFGHNSGHSWLNLPLSVHPPLLPVGIQQRETTLNKMNIPSLDLSVNRSISDCVVPSSHTSSNFLSTVSLLQRSTRKNMKSYHMNIPENSRNLTKAQAIFNQVLDSPWCPRLPYNYRPFRRKLTGVIKNSIQNEKKIEETCVNDSNNNIEQALVLEQCKSNAQRNKDDFKCDVCNQVFISEECLNGHMKRHTTAARYSCGECGKTFSQLRNFKYHMSVHRGTREFAATCTVCGKYFNDRGYLSSHMKIHRNRKEYKCTLCPKSFNQRVAYNMHVRIHTGVKPHVCEECGKAFSRKMLLKQHQRTHSGERPYACPHCDKRFADRSNMTLHLRLHTGVKPFSCSLCPKSFTKKHHLKSHLNFHTGAKPYSCPRCKLAFTQSSNMRTHMKKCNAVEESQPPS